MTSRRLLLLDSASLYFRAFYGVPERSTVDGVPNNAVRGFTDMLATLITRYEPTDLVACWDDDWRPAFRVEAIPSYKAHRVRLGADGAEEDSPENLTPRCRSSSTSSRRPASRVSAPRGTRRTT